MAIFLDHNATTFPSKEVLKKISQFTNWGNPSSIHSSGRGAKAEILKTRRLFAGYLGVKPGEITFTSGGSEANNFAIKGVLNKLKERGQDTLITSSVEHPSVMKAFKQVEGMGFKVLYIPVDKSKGLDFDFLEKALEQNQVGFVSCMKANNETGVVFDIHKIRKIINDHQKEHKIYFHSDMVQALGKLKIDVSPVDFASFSAHKFYALQGTGVLYHKQGVGVEPLITGGGQERGRRAGTENLLGIAAFGVQVEQLKNLFTKVETMKSLRDSMESKILNSIDGVCFLAQNQERVSNTSLILIEGVHGETMLINLDLKGFEVSTGAACSSGNPEPSPVLLAMGLSNQEASLSLRVSLGWESTQEQVDAFVKVLSDVVHKIRSL